MEEEEERGEEEKERALERERSPGLHALCRSTFTIGSLERLHSQ